MLEQFFWLVLKKIFFCCVKRFFFGWWQGRSGAERSGAEAEGHSGAECSGTESLPPTKEKKVFSQKKRILFLE